MLSVLAKAAELRPECDNIVVGLGTVQKREVVGMIQSGTVYVIAQDFEGTLEFYRKLLERDVAAQNKTRFAIFRIGGLVVCDERLF